MEVSSPAAPSSEPWEEPTLDVWLAEMVALDHRANSAGWLELGLPFTRDALSRWARRWLRDAGAGAGWPPGCPPSE
jgi:hypothetical protein